MRRNILILTLLVVAALKGGAQNDSRPWTFWYWMYGAVSKDGIHADLQGMKDVGLGGFYLMPIRGVTDRPEYEGKAEQLTPEYWNMVGYAMQQADSLGLDMGVHICDGFALAGGPWITPSESMQKVVYTDTLVTGDVRGLRMPAPHTTDGYYGDIATLALRLDKKSERTGVDDVIPFANMTFSGEDVTVEKGVVRANKSCVLNYDFGKDVTIRNIEVVPAGNNIQCQRFHVSVEGQDGVFRDVLDMEPPRQGWQNTGYNYTFSIPPTKTRRIKLIWSPSGSEPGAEDLDAAKWRPNLKVKEIIFHGEPRISQWQGKAGNVWRIAGRDNNIPASDCFKAKDVRILTVRDGVITSKLPKGRWLIIRFCHASTGQTNATAGGAKGLEVDKFSSKAVNKLLDNWFGAFMSLPHSNVVKCLHVDSWECGCQNWGENFADEFKSRRGYDLLPWLPVMIGLPIESAEKSETVLRDIRQTINDLINEKFFVTLKERAEAHNLMLSSESVAPTMVSDGMEHYRYADLPMGEFWLNSPTHDKPNDMLDAISGAHVYGKPIVQAEGFTEVRGIWNETPAMVKPLLDRYFALGMNKLFFHVNTHNPWMDRKPGMTLDGIGLFFQRDQTWYPEARAFVDYIRRCQKRLQAGVPVVDIAVFTGEEMPARSVLPDRLIYTLPGLMGDTLVNAQRQRLINEGQPMEESPVGVNHSAGILDLKDMINPLRGYHYDSMNKDALLNVAKIEDGRIVMPSGIEYRVFVLPLNNPLDPSRLPLSREMQVKIEEMRAKGVVVIDNEYKDMDLSQYGIQRDIVLPHGIAYWHVRGNDVGYNLMSRNDYFISNQTDHNRTFTAVLRDKDGERVNVYNPVTGTTDYEVGKRNKDGLWEVALDLPPYGSVFIEINYDPSRNSFNRWKAKNAEQKEITQWTLDFVENSKQIADTTLFDWTTSADDSIRYFSGHVDYTATFELEELQDNGKVMLQLGKVCDIADVYINGQPCGTAWTAPYEVDVTKQVRKGRNDLRIRVVNTWNNALFGSDNGTPPYSGIWTNAKYRSKEKNLLPAGLIGPVMLKIEY